MDATATGNYELFLTVGDSDYKADITKEIFDQVGTSRESCLIGRDSNHSGLKFASVKF